MERNFQRSEAVTKSEFYLNSTYKVLNNTINRVLTLQLSSIGLNMSTEQICLKNAQLVLLVAAVEPFHMLNVFPGYFQLASYPLYIILQFSQVASQPYLNSIFGRYKDNVYPIFAPLTQNDMPFVKSGLDFVADRLFLGAIFILNSLCQKF